MRHQTVRRAGTAALGTLLLAAPGLAQQREYYVRGRVLDTDKKPVPAVEIRLRDDAASRTYDIKTDKQGVFKLAGLPHGIYQVTLVKDGYSSAKTEWKFETPQDSMQRVEVPDIVLATESQLQEAERRKQEAERLKEADANLRQAAEKIRKGDFDGAIALAQGVLAKNPKDTNALFFTGLSHARKKMHREAIDALVQVTQLNPTFAPAYFELGVSYRQTGDLPKALESYDKNLQLDATNAASAYNAGLILFETNRIDEALARFEQALASKPEDSEALEMVGRCYLHHGKLKGAVEYLERARAASSDPAKVAFLDDLVRKARAQMR